MIIGNNTRALHMGDPEPPLVPGRGRIYGLRFCPWVERVMLYAAAKGIEVEIVNIDVTNKPEWYFNKHPQGKIPSFEKDGKILFESSIIAEYLDAVYPDSSILPTDPYLRAKQKILLEQAAPLSSAFFGLYAVFGGVVQGAAKEEKIKAVEDALDVVEKLLKDDYFGGSAAGYADWMVFPLVERVALLSSPVSMPSPFPSPRWPSLSAWWGRISAHPATAAAVQPAEVNLAFIKSLMSGQPASDLGL